VAIKSFFEIQKPEEVVMRLTLTMPLKEWHQVSQRLAISDASEPDDQYWHPAQQVVRMIGEMTEKAKASFWDSASKADGDQ
jgi:hypothetical protein